MLQKSVYSWQMGIYNCNGLGKHVLEFNTDLIAKEEPLQLRVCLPYCVHPKSKDLLKANKTNTQWRMCWLQSLKYLLLDFTVKAQ
jgi:hypothetical protein